MRSLARQPVERRHDPGHDVIVGDARHGDELAAAARGRRPRRVRRRDGQAGRVQRAPDARDRRQPRSAAGHPRRDAAARRSGRSPCCPPAARSTAPTRRPPRRRPRRCGRSARTASSRSPAERYVALYARQHGLSADILRCANVYGPGEPTHGSQGLIGVTRAALRAHRPVVVYGDGSTRRDFVHVDDVAGAVVALAARPDGVRVLNVGSGRSESVLEVIDGGGADSLGRRPCWSTGPAGRPTYPSSSWTSAPSAPSSTSNPATWPPDWTERPAARVTFPALTG